MDYYEEPGQPGFYRYATNRYPYVEVEHDGELIHAQARAWKADKVMVAKPVGQRQRVDNSRTEIHWVPATACTRIRYTDSAWITTEDDYEWHKSQDLTIEYGAQSIGV